MAGGDQSLIVKKIKKGGHAHHGGAWKVAYADFVTAMMAFFLLLWLLNAVTEEQLEGISNYFSPENISMSESGAGGMLGGKVIGETGAMPDTTARPSVTVDLPPPRAGTGGDEFAGEKQAASEETGEEEDAATRQAREEREFQQAEQEIRQAIESVPSLKELAKSLLIENTPEGLRIQIVDQEGLAMFPRGGSEMFPYTRKVLDLVAKVITKMPQKISIAGHTDATRFVGGEAGYTNWELSADRANASRRALIELGVPSDRVSVVVGKAATDPLVANDPENPSNRRISIVLLRGTAAESQPPQESQTAPAPAETNGGIDIPPPSNGSN